MRPTAPTPRSSPGAARHRDPARRTGGCLADHDRCPWPVPDGNHDGYSLASGNLWLHCSGAAPAPCALWVRGPGRQVTTFGVADPRGPACRGSSTAAHADSRMVDGGSTSCCRRLFSGFWGGPVARPESGRAQARRADPAPRPVPRPSRPNRPGSRHGHRADGTKATRSGLISDPRTSCNRRAETRQSDLDRRADTRGQVRLHLHVAAGSYASTLYVTPDNLHLFAPLERPRRRDHQHRPVRAAGTGPSLRACFRFPWGTCSQCSG